jgi:predicted amidohydrolase
MTPGLSRRRFVGAGTLAAASGLGASATMADAGKAASGPVASPHDGGTPRARGSVFAALRSDTPVIALVQSAPCSVDLERPLPDLARNLRRMLDSIDAAQSAEQRSDWVAFHDCPLTGRVAPVGEARKRVALDLDGEHFQHLADAARRHACWLSFGAWLRLPHARGAAIEATAFISPAGALVSAQPFDGRLQPGSPLPAIAVTDIGNLAATPRADDPVHHAALVAAGAEFVLRTNSGPLADWALDLPVCCRAHGIHGAIVSAAATASTPFPARDLIGGGSAFFGPDGRRLAAAEGSDEQILRWAVPIGAQRRSAAVAA